jgi:hypothetical protein
MPNVLRATIVRGICDTILINFDAPEPCWPYRGNLTMKFIAPSGTGEAYVKEWFGVTAEVIGNSR